MRVSAKTSIALSEIIRGEREFLWSKVPEYKFCRFSGLP